MNILFVCSMGRFRSKTAALCLKAVWNEVRYRGTEPDAESVVHRNDLEWADVIVCMEQQHKTKIRRRFRGFTHNCQVWGIPDIYGLMDDTLVHQLRVRAENLLEDRPLDEMPANSKTTN